MKQIIFLLILVLTSSIIYGQNKPITGTIKGKVVDSRELFPLIGVTVTIKDKNGGTYTDNEGKFELKNLPVGSYSLILSYIGYEKSTRTDIIVRPDRITFAEFEMNQSSVEMKDIIVSAGYFSKIEAKPASNVTFSSEEIRRSPGSAGDVSRIIFGLLSLAKLNDQKNSKQYPLYRGE